MNVYQTSQELSRIMQRRFEIEDLKALCFDLNGYEYQDLEGDSKRAKIRSLLKKAENRHQLDLIISWIRAERPDINIQHLNRARSAYQPEKRRRYAYASKQPVRPQNNWTLLGLLNFLFVKHLPIGTFLSGAFLALILFSMLTRPQQQDEVSLAEEAASPAIVSQAEVTHLVTAESSDRELTRLQQENEGLKLTIEALSLSESSLQVPTATPIITSDNSNIFSIDLEQFEEGDFAVEYGKDLMVVSRNDRKYLRGLEANSVFEVTDLNISPPFSIQISVSHLHFISAFNFASKEGEIVEARTYFDAQGFGGISSKYLNWNREDSGIPNLLIFEVADGAAKLSINGEFFSSEPVGNQFTLDSFTIGGLRSNHRIYDFRVTQN